MKFASFLPLVLVLCLYGSTPVAADPVVFPFSVHVTEAFGPMDDLFGRTFQIGDELTGRIIFDGTAGPDQAPSETHGTFDVPSGRMELDVPSGFALDAAHVDTFTADTFNDFRRGSFDELIFSVSTCCHSSGIGFVVADALWTDTTQHALTSDRLPTDPAVLNGFPRAAFGLLAGSQDPIALFGESAPFVPVPEPGTLVLLLTGLGTRIALSGSLRRRISSREP
jgi:hypothetical protein